MNQMEIFKNPEFGSKDTPNEAWEKAKGQYGRVADAVKIIDPRKE